VPAVRQKFHLAPCAKFRDRLLGKLSRKAKACGLILTDEDEEVFLLMTETDAVIRSRYIMTGFHRWPEIDALDRTCVRLRINSHAEVGQKGNS
jgi:hypothetical protein